jgi:hypothetical protein
VQKIARPSRKAQHYLCQNILLLPIRCSRTIRLRFGTLMLLYTHIVLAITSQIENKSTKAPVSAGKIGKRMTQYFSRQNAKDIFFTGGKFTPWAEPRKLLPYRLCLFHLVWHDNVKPSTRRVSRILPVIQMPESVDLRCASIISGQSGAPNFIGRNFSA